MADIHYDADVLIVGAGPSGSLCAYYLAKAGKKVILIDSENFPRDKICGDFVSPVGLKELKKLGIWELDGFEKTNSITSATVYVDGFPLITKNLPDIEGLCNYGRVIPRLILDNWILLAARKQGVQVVTPCKFENYSVHDNHVKVECNSEGNKQVFHSRLLIGADGSKSKVARILSGKKPDPQYRIVAVRAYFENVNCVTHQAEIFFNSNSFPGYSWFFPTGPSTANVGIGMMLENFPKEKTNLKKLLLDMIENDLSFKAKIGNGIIVDRIAAFPLTIFNPKDRLVKKRVMLIGDAAGLVNSINGEGMQHAMLSGRWAAESVIKCLSTNDLSDKALSVYEKLVRAELGYDLGISNTVMQFIRNRNLNHLWLNLLKIMIIQAKKDEKYANIAGGILAGMVPTNRAIHFYFLRKSLLRGLLIGCQGTFGIFKSIKRTLLLFIKVSSQIFKQRADYFNWFRSISRSILQTLKLYRR